MRTFDPSFLLLLLLSVLAATYSPSAASQEVATPEATSVTYTSAKTGLVVHLPTGWTGTQAIDEVALPARAVYRWESTDTATQGAIVIVERAVGLNPLLEERWRRGQVASGYNGLRPRAPLAEDKMLLGPGVGVEISEGDQIGRAYFVQRGQILWAVHVSAPAYTLASRATLLDELVRGVRLSDKETEPEPSASR